MKGQTTFWLIASMFFNCKMNDETKPFIAEKVSRSASFEVNYGIEQVFPMFGAFEERKWAPGWEPRLIYPQTEIIEEGTTFKVSGKNHGHGDDYGKEDEYLWIVTKLDAQGHLIQYLVSTPNRFWTITVDCESISKEKTNVEVTYSYIGLNEKGNALNKLSLEEMYKNNLQDWAKAVNSYLEK